MFDYDVGNLKLRNVIIFGFPYTLLLKYKIIVGFPLIP
jgi:hypothetical protein